MTIMKKAYMAPVIKEQRIELTHIVCESGVSGTLNPNQSISNSNQIGSRGGLWDDDEEE